MIFLNLTSCNGLRMIDVSCNSTTGIDPPHKGRKRPLSSVVFLYPSKTQLYSVMVGCIGQPLKRLAASFGGRINPIQSATQSLIPLVGGSSLYKGIPQ